MTAATTSRAWQRMLSGRRLDLLDPSPLDVEIEDIALGLSRVARWNGQTIGSHGFSVAQHCVLVVELVRRAESDAPRALLLAALLHDAGEYVTSDLITPFKAAVGDRYKTIEHAIERAVNLRFGLPGALPADWVATIKRADRHAAFMEAVQLAGFTEPEARKIFKYRSVPPDIRLVPQPPETARADYLRVFADLVA